MKDLHQESHEKSKSKSSFVWNSMSGKGNTDETVLQSQLIAQGEIAIKAVEGLKIDIKQIDQKTVSETVDAMVAADPQLAWLKQVEQRGDVDWRRVKEQVQPLGLGRRCCDHHRNHRCLLHGWRCQWFGRQ